MESALHTPQSESWVDVLRRTLISPDQRHLKWSQLDVLEAMLVVASAVLLFLFIATVVADVGLRTIQHPWLTAPEWTLAFFIWGCFIGAAAAVRRDQHFKLGAVGAHLRGRARIALETFNRLVILLVALSMAGFGYQLFVTGFSVYLQPSITPIAPIYAAIPISGALMADRKSVV